MDESLSIPIERLILDDERMCSSIEIGEYRATRGLVAFEAAVINEDTMILSVSGVVTEDGGGFMVDQAPSASHSFKYALMPNCSIILDAPLEFETLMTALAGMLFAPLNKDSPLEYLESIGAVRVGPVVLNRPARVIRAFRCMRSIIGEHFLAHITGTTYVVRLLDENKAFIEVVSLAGADGTKEVSVSGVLDYRVTQQNRIRLARPENFNEGLLNTVYTQFLEAGTIEANSTISFSVTAERDSLRLGSLELHKDVSSVNDLFLNEGICENVDI
jgi:hypothetical protein